VACASAGDPVSLFKQAVTSGDARRLRELLGIYAELRSQISQPLFAFDSLAINCAAGHGYRDVIDVLLEAGADINARSQWWAGGFGVLDSADPELAAYLIERGAVVDVHAAARLGMLAKLRELISADPALVHARGGDGQTPLHFSASVEIAAYLLDQGADIDAIDVDHESTAAQYLVQSHPEVVRFLIRRGCRTDILMAAAVGDTDLVRRHLDADPESIRMRVNDQYFPKRNARSGGTIYIWTLGANKSAPQVASKFGHADVLRLLMERSPVELKLATACLIGDEKTVETILASYPNLADTLPDADRRQISAAAEDNNVAAVRLMLTHGWPVDGGQGQTPLHWAAWHGNAEMARLILRHKPPLEQRDPEYHATPLGWAIHGSLHGWHRKTGDYAAVVQALLQSGVKPPEEIEGSEAVRRVLTANRPPRKS
jgi:ankyrin repeat protein